MSGAEIGSAYVRIRPNTATFRTEAKAGVLGAFSNLGKIVVPTLAFAGITEGIRKSVQAAELKQVVAGQLENAFRTAGLNYQQYASVVDTAVKKNKELGFSFDESEQVIGRAVRATRNLPVALKLVATATDLARGQNIPLATSAQILIRAYNGQTAGLKRLGVEVTKGVSGVKALDAVESRFSGSAQKYAGTAAGAQAQLSAAIQETEAVIGTALLPTVTRLNTRLANWLDNTRHQQELQDAVNKVVHKGGVVIGELTAAFNAVKGPVKDVVDLFGGFGHVIESVLIIGLLAKAKRATLGLAGLRQEVGPLTGAFGAFTRSAAGFDVAATTGAKALAGLGTTGQEATTTIAAGVDADIEALNLLANTAERTAGKLAVTGRVGGAASGQLTRPLLAGAASDLVGSDESQQALNEIANQLAQISSFDTSVFVTKEVESLARVGKSAQTELSAVGEQTKRGLLSSSAAATDLGAALTRSSEEGVAGQRRLAGATDATTTAINLEAAAADRLALSQRAGTFAGQKIAFVPGVGSLSKSIVGAGGLGRLLGKVVGRGLGAALKVYIANAIIESFTGFDPLGKVTAATPSLIGKLLHPAPSGPVEISAGLAETNKELAAYRSSLSGLDAVTARVNKRTADHALAVAREKLALDKSDHSSLHYLTSLQNVAEAEENAKLAHQGLADVLSKGSEKTREAQQELTALAQTIATRYLAQEHQATYAALQQGKQLDSTKKSAYAYAASLTEAAHQTSGLSDVQRHNLTLLAEYIRTLGHVPKHLTTTEKLILDNTDARKGIAELEADLAKVQKDANIKSFFTVKFSEDTGGGGGVTTGPVRPRTIGKFAQLALDIAQAQAKGNQKALRAAYADELKLAQGTEDFLAKRKDVLLRTAKGRQKYYEQSAAAYAAEKDARTGIEGIDQAAEQKRRDAEAKAKRLRDAARAAAKAAAAKAHRVYLGDLADREQSLTQRATDTRKSALGLAAKGHAVASATKRLFELPGSAAGLVSPGNIDLLHRKIAHLASGAIATVHSFSVSTDRGEVLLSQVINGRLVSVKKAIEHYRKTGENLGIFKTIADANDYADRLHLEQASIYTKLGKAPSPPVGLKAQVKAADDKVIAFYTAEAHNAKLTGTEKRAARKKLKTAKEQEKKDIASIGTTVQKARDDALQTEITLAQLAVARGKGSQAHLAALQREQENRERSALRDELTSQTKLANDKSLSAAARRAAADKALAAENQLVQLSVKDADTRRTGLSLVLKAAENRVAAAKQSGSPAALDAALTAEKKALQTIIDFDTKEIKLFKGNVDEQQKLKADRLDAQGQLIKLTKPKTSPLDFASLYADVAADFKSYGGNLATVGQPLSPHDAIRDVQRIMLANLPKGAGKPANHTTIVQNINTPINAGEALRSAFQIAKNVLAG